MKLPTGLPLGIIIADAVVGPLLLVIGLRGLWMRARARRQTGAPPTEPLWSSLPMLLFIWGAVCIPPAMVILLGPIIGEWAWLGTAPFVLLFLIWLMGLFVQAVIEGQHRTPG